ncbi:MAG: hypothetical protein ACK559_32100, partial [bacterium]
ERDRARAVGAVGEASLRVAEPPQRVEGGVLVGLQLDGALDERGGAFADLAARQARPSQVVEEHGAVGLDRKAGLQDALAAGRIAEELEDPRHRDEVARVAVGLAEGAVPGAPKLRGKRHGRIRATADRAVAGDRGT